MSFKETVEHWSLPV